MATPSMVKTISRHLAKKEQDMLVNKQAKQTSKTTAKVSEMNASPAQQITNEIIAQQQRQFSLQQIEAKNRAQIFKQMFYKPSDVLKRQREQLALQEEQVKTQIKQKQKEQEYTKIAPKTTVQNSESSDYIGQEQLNMLEKIYVGLPPQKKYNMAKLGPVVQYYQPLQNYSGGFVNPNYDKQLRPLGKDTTKLVDF